MRVLKNKFYRPLLLLLAGVVCIGVPCKSKAASTFLSFPMDTDPGWTMQGDWEFGVPLGNANDPASGLHGNNVVGYNLAGTYGEFNSPHWLTTTSLDCSDWVNVQLKFRRWATFDGSPFPMGVIEVTNDPQNWEGNYVWLHNSTTSLIDTNWVEVVYDISAIADRKANVRIRWGMGSHNESQYGTLTNGGWNIDDVEFLGDPADPLIMTPAVGWGATTLQGSLPDPSNQVYTITNLNTSSSFGWTAESSESWLSISPTNGTLAASSGTNLTLSINNMGMLPGFYTAEFLVSNQNSSNTESRVVSLTITEVPGAIDLSPLSGFVVTNLIGQQQQRTLVVSNSAIVGKLDYSIELQQTGYGPPEEPMAPAPAMARVAAFAMPGKIEKSYSFADPVIAVQGEYDRVDIQELESYHRIGAPIVPVKPVSVTIPDGMTLSNVRVEILEETELEGAYMLPPAQRLRINVDESDGAETLPDPAVYSLAQNWPGKTVEESGRFDRRGEQFVNINLFPLQFNPVSGKITVAQRMRLVLELESNMQSLAAPMTRVAAAETTSLPPGGPFKHIIITSAAMAAAPSPWNFQALRDKRTSEGVASTIVTTEWIYSNYDGTRPDGGTDNQTKIRNFLMDAYENWDTEYALLGGGIDVVPARFFRVDHLRGNNEPVDPIDDFPVDLYYGCLSPSACTFDSNTNGIYGELDDGIAGEDVDLVAEVFIGRAPVEDIDEVANFVRKTITYAESQDPYLLKVSMVGEKLHSNPDLYGSDMLEQVRLGGSFDGQITKSFGNHTRNDIPALTYTNLYEVESFWTTNDLANLVNGEGVHILNCLGHSNEHEAFRKTKPYNLWKIFGNTNAFFHYSQSCEVGAFDLGDPIVEEMVAMEHGAFAAVANVRYGWGAEGAANVSPYCPSNRFNREFWNSMFEKGIMELGKINQDAKEQLLWDVTGENPGSAMRWTYLELTLFGDPAQRLHFPYQPEWLSVDPMAGNGILPSNHVGVAVNFDATEVASGSYTGEITVTSNDAGNPVQVVPAVMVVLPDNLSVSPEWGYDFSGEAGALSLPYNMFYGLTNSGVASENWVVTNSASWLDISPANGTLAPYTQTNLTLTINATANTLPQGLYSTMVTFSNASSGATFTRNIGMTISASSATNDIIPPSCIIVRDDVSPTAASNVNFSIIFSEDVTGFDQSDVSLTGSAPGKSVTGFAGSGSNYTVAVGITGSGTVALNVDAGVCVDLAGNTNTAGAAVAYSIDQDDPIITSITSATTNGIYSAGQEINVTLNFSEPVTLGGGTLVITLDTGGTDREVLISAITNTNIASGVFTVEGGDESADLSVSGITLNGGTLYDAAGNSTDLSIPSGQNLNDNTDVVLEKATYVINAGKIGAGTIVPEGALSAVHGSTTNFMIEASGNYHIASIEIDGNHIAGSPYSGTDLTSTNLTWDNITGNGTITATFTSSAPTLTVVSAHGGANPGTVTVGWGTVLSPEVTNSPVLGGMGTQYVCVAGTVLNNDFTQMSPTNVMLTLTNDASLVWQWETQFELVTVTNENGSITAADGWYTAGSNAVLTAAASNNYHLAYWTGDTNESVIVGETITVPMTQARSIGAVFALNEHTFEIISAHGVSDPVAGIYTNSYGAALSNSVDAIETLGTTQFVNTGWSMVGHGPALGTTNAMTMAHTNDAVLTWTWDTNYWLAVDSIGGGSVNSSNDWISAESNVVITAAASNNYHFAYWTGDTNESVIAGETITVPMTQTRSIGAVFALNEHTFEIVSAHGVTDPVAGIYTNSYGAALSNSVVAIETLGTTQFVNTGWSMVGHDPALGTTNTLTMAHTNDAVLTWQWSTNYWLEVDAVGAGSVDVSNQWISAESNVLITAAASNTYHFSHWTGDTNGSVIVDETISVPMTKARSIGAVFALNEHTFEIVSAHGMSDPVAGIYTNSYGAVLSNSVDAIETLGSTQYVNAGWSMIGHDPALGTTNALTVSHTNDAVLTWQWSTNYWLEVDSVGAGSVDVSNHWISAESNVIITAAASNTYHFSHWTGDTNGSVSVDETITLPMTQARSIGAVFVLNEHTFEIVSAHGMSDPVAGIYTNSYGAALSNSVDAIETLGSTQYVNTGWSMIGHDPALGTTNALTMSHTNDAVLTWQWSTNYWLEVDAVGAGSVDVSNHWISAESNVVITAAASNTYHFSHWTGDTNDSVIAGETISVPMTQARSIGAVFVLNEHTFEIISAHGVSDPVAGIYTNSYGAALSNSVDAIETLGTTQFVNTGWSMVGHDPALGTTNALTMSHTNDAVLTWTWDTNYWLAVDSIGGGSVNSSNDWISAGSNVVITAAASNNYHLAYWTGDTNESVITSETISVPMTKARSIGAVFALNEHTFEIISAHGVSDPVAGIYTNSYGAALSNSVDAIETLGTTQFVNTGWSMIGHDPSLGTTNAMTMAHTNDAVLTWQWSTNYWLEVDAVGAGSVDVSNQWISAESNVLITAAASNTYHFSHWTGDTNGSVIVDETISVPMTKARSIGAVFALNEHTFEIVSAHGMSDPVTGIYTNSYGAALSNSVDAIETLGTTQFVNTGWSMVGHDPALGTTNAMTMAHTNDAVLTWQWSTNYWLEVDSVGAGSVDVSNHWISAESNVIITAAASNTYHFSHWTGDTNESVIVDETITVPMTQARSMGAVFVLNEHKFEIVSAHGVTDPVAGIYTNSYGAALSNSVDAIETLGTTQFVNTGWSMIGHDPSLGTTNAMTMAHTNDAVLTWQWSTNYWLETEIVGQGSVSVADGWYAEGVTNILSAIPEPGYLFVGWSGSVDSTNNPLTLVMTEANVLTATFTDDRDGDELPDWWETQYFGDPTNAVASAISSNGINTLLEAYIAGLDPRDSQSVFEVYSYNENVGGTNQFVLEWNSLEGRYYNIHWTSNLFNGFQPLETGLESPQNTYTDMTYSVSNSFYKLDVELK